MSIDKIKNMTVVSSVSFMTIFLTNISGDSFMTSGKWDNSS